MFLYLFRTQMLFIIASKVSTIISCVLPFAKLSVSAQGAGFGRCQSGKTKTATYLSFARRALSAWVVVGLEAETSKVLEGQGKSLNKFHKE